ncbi:hypothetical protein ACMD2_23484 [Ananas comosus]|uniref:Uncharacterized protein n=1 Tax=Ananas comosus TaxID=4615 RepID=A0A199VAC8_ANACO|nr:hypothetical protein ACMD2_23484 [Ananas comosus]
MVHRSPHDEAAGGEDGHLHGEHRRRRRRAGGSSGRAAEGGRVVEEAGGVLSVRALCDGGVGEEELEAVRGGGEGEEGSEGEGEGGFEGGEEGGEEVGEEEALDRGEVQPDDVEEATDPSGGDTRHWKRGRRRGGGGHCWR